MKRYIIFSVTLALAMTSCNDYLDIENKSSVSDYQYFSSKSGFQNLLNNAYESLHDVYASSSYEAYFQAGTDLYGDGRSQNDVGLHQYETLTPENSAMKSLYQSCYVGIRKAYAVLHYAETANVDDATKKSAIAQARVLAANYYYILVNTFGGVPLMKEYVQNAEIGYPKSSAIEVYEYIISELEEVVSSNALKASTATAGGGEISLETAKAILAKTYLAAGWDLNNNAYFSKAAQYADEVISNRQLTTPFADLWDGNGTNDDNAEFIWDLEYDLATANNSVKGGHRWSSHHCNHFGGQEDHGKSTHSVYIATLHALQYFERGDVRYETTFMKELPDISSKSPYSYWDYYRNNRSFIGEPINYYYAAWYETDADIEAWRAIDPDNRANTLIIPQSDNTQEPSENGKPINYEALVTYTMANSAVKKFDDGMNAKYDDNTDYRDIHIITLPEMYLVAAEAFLKAGNTSDALARLNTVRNRAQLPVTTGIDIDVILKERACELFGQGSRWIDLRRTQKLVEYNDLYNPQIRGRAALCIGQKLLRPIPQGAIDANESLSNADQNPGY